jgi:hypothetical protein
LVVFRVDCDLDTVLVERALNEENTPGNNQLLRVLVLVHRLPAPVLRAEVIVRLKEDIMKSTELAISVTYKNLLVSHLGERGAIAATVEHEGILKRLSHLGGCLRDSEVRDVGRAPGYPHFAPIDVDIRSSTCRLAPSLDVGVPLNPALQIHHPH